jgi:hypothetical protein
MPGAVATGPKRGEAEVELVPGAGDVFNTCGEAGTVLVVADLETSPEPWGVSVDSLQAVARNIKRTTIIRLKRFIRNLSLLSSRPVTGSK